MRRAWYLLRLKLHYATHRTWDVCLDVPSDATERAPVGSYYTAWGARQAIRRVNRLDSRYPKHVERKPGMG